jgi:hypothetical protein
MPGALSESSTVFVSHCGQDKPLARQVAAGLAAHGIGVWFDEWRIGLGDSIPHRIDEGLASATHFLLIWSQAAANSPWVQDELNACLYQVISMKHTVIVVQLDGTPVPPLIAHRRGIRSDSVSVILEHLLGPGKDEKMIRAAIVALGARLRSLLERDAQNDLGRCPKCGSSEVYDRHVPYGNDDLATFTICGTCGEELGHIV